MSILILKNIIIKSIKIIIIVGILIKVGTVQVTVLRQAQEQIIVINKDHKINKTNNNHLHPNKMAKTIIIIAILMKKLIMIFKAKILTKILVKTIKKICIIMEKLRKDVYIKIYMSLMRKN